MTDEKILETPILDGDLPNDHRPDDEWIAARLRVDHEFRRRMAAGVQRKVKRNFQGGMSTGYTTGDEMWCHFKPSEEVLRRWIEEEGQGEKRLNEDVAIEGRNSSEQNKIDGLHETAANDHSTGQHLDEHDMPVWRSGSRKYFTGSSQPVQGIYHEDEQATHHTRGRTAEGSSSQVNRAPTESWLGLKHTLKDGA